MLRFKKAVWFHEEATTQGTRLQNQLHKLRREHKLTRDSREKQLLGKIIKSREKELSLIGKIRAEIKSELVELFPGNGINLTSIRGIGMITAARIVAHTGGIERFRNRDAYVRYTGIAPLPEVPGKEHFLSRQTGATVS